ncbi:hypothetical protein OESDEN_10031 [Oesophagostomum dentatum]|uniref:Uncharacterized protein n=1 Tax=Oesophagostomum dentatum TaxID=61180 RepID=A0A0B1SYV8_OESDE|nr:hypothetical protein OESDEN_10031 [Oesophagostomum dentatum]
MLVRFLSWLADAHAEAGLETRLPYGRFQVANASSSHCTYLLFSETTAKGMGLAKIAGKEDSVELDSTLTL